MTEDTQEEGMTDDEIAATIRGLEDEIRDLIGEISDRDADGTWNGSAEAETQACLAHARQNLLHAHHEFTEEMRATPRSVVVDNEELRRAIEKHGSSTAFRMMSDD